MTVKDTDISQYVIDALAALDAIVEPQDMSANDQEQVEKAKQLLRDSLEA